MPRNTHHHDQATLHTQQGAEQLVTIETQAEFDLLSGQRSERIFLKMYVAARTSGLLATISVRNWKTLCVLATYMDADGYCFPSQTELAKALGCSRQMVSERVNALAEFRFNGQPVLLIVDAGHGQRGRFTRNGYRVLPISSLRIFGDNAAPEKQDIVEEKPRGDKESTVSTFLDTVPNFEHTVSSQTGTVQLDTNYNHRNNKRNISNIRKAATGKKCGGRKTWCKPISTQPDCIPPHHPCFDYSTCLPPP